MLALCLGAFQLQEALHKFCLGHVTSTLFVGIFVVQPLHTAKAYDRPSLPVAGSVTQQWPACQMTSTPATLPPAAPTWQPAPTTPSSWVCSFSQTGTCFTGAPPAASSSHSAGVSVSLSVESVWIRTGGEKRFGRAVAHTYAVCICYLSVTLATAAMP